MKASKLKTEVEIDTKPLKEVRDLLKEIREYCKELGIGKRQAKKLFTANKSKAAEFLYREGIITFNEMRQRKGLPSIGDEGDRFDISSEALYRDYLGQVRVATKPATPRPEI
jgi:hypothetical protein